MTTEDRQFSASKAGGEWRIPAPALDPFRRTSASAPPEPSAPAEPQDGTASGSPPATERKSAGSPPEPEAVTGTELVRLVTRQQDQLLQMAGRIGWLESQLQVAQARILALEA